MRLSLTCFVILCFLKCSLGSRILFLYTLASKSHVNVIQPLVEGLVAKGHEVTIVSPVRMSIPKLIQLNPLSVTDSVTSFLGKSPFDIRRAGRFAFSASFDMKPILRHSEKVHADPKFQELIQKPYDLVIISAFLNEGFLGVLVKIGAPYIFVTPMPAPSFLTKFTGNYLPSSFVPVPFWDFENVNHMTFMDRLTNFFIVSFFQVTEHWMHEALQEFNQRVYMDSNLPPMSTIYGNMSLILSNSHFSLNQPRPNLPDNVEVGGLQCRPAKPLSDDLEKWISDSPHGFIFFSMGSIVKSSEMPEEFRKVFVETFAKLKQKVLWKWETEEMPDLPPNVKLSKWIPQQDVLGHPQIKLFMTHGGLLSTQEAAYHGVPLLGIPVFADQDLNMKSAEAGGYALTIEILNITQTELYNKIQKLITEPRFSKRAKELSAIVTDQPETPLDRAIYWVEYVIRHKGAKHLRSSGRNLNYLQIHSYDVIGVLFLVSLAIIFAIKFTLCCIYSKLFHTNKSTKQKEQ